MAVTLHKAFIDPWANKPVHESVLHLRRIKWGRRLSWIDRRELQDNSLDGLRYVLRAPAFYKRYIYDYDDVRGFWGTWDCEEERFVGHTGTENGARLQARRMNQEGR